MEKAMLQNCKKITRGDIVGALNLFGFYQAIKQAVEDLGGDEKHLERVLRQPMLQRQIAGLIVKDADLPVSSQLFLGEYEQPQDDIECSVFVDYQMPRSKAELEAEFSSDGISPIFYGSSWWWMYNRFCEQMDMRPGWRKMRIKHFGYITMIDGNNVEMDKAGFRPATHLEAYAFAKANPELQLAFSSRH